MAQQPKPEPRTKKAREGFVERWKGQGAEKQDAQTFWLDLLETVFGIPVSDRYIKFEGKVDLVGAPKYLDGYIDKTKVVVEQKSFGIDLSKSYVQSGGLSLTPYQQAKRYVDNLPASQHAKWIIVCNFQEFWVYNLEKTGEEREKPLKLKLEDLIDNEDKFFFLEDPDIKKIIEEEKLSVEAGKVVGRLYKLLSKAFNENDELTEEQEKQLNKLCVRLVFCLYAEDAKVLGPRKLMFHDYLQRFKPLGAQAVRDALVALFKTLATPEDKRDPYAGKELNSFEYVDGGLFKEEQYVIPHFTDDIVDLLLDQASGGIDWRDISPTIFGAVFEATLNPVTRREGGMHYTSSTNIHRVIDPLFLDGLKDDLKKIEDIKIESRKNRALQDFQKRLSSLKFLDPACGSGNFLTETYLELRRLENKALQLLSKGQGFLGEGLSPIQVTLDQFYGIEKNDFAVSVAQTALWIAESQMMKETQDIVPNSDLHFLPLTSKAHIKEGNALREDWNQLVPASEISYIMGNPPFVGYKYQSKEQKDDLEYVYPEAKSAIDYVAGWYFKTAMYLDEGVSYARCAYVSTNSLSQGEHINNVWKPLMEKFGMHIQFAYQTFKWSSETAHSAAVHVIVVGFGKENPAHKILFGKNGRQIVSNINAYLTDAPQVYVEPRATPISTVSVAYKGSVSADDGNFLLTEEERTSLLAKNPELDQYIRPYKVARDFIDSKASPRYCLWLVGAPSQVLENSFIKDRVKKVRDFRLTRTRAATVKGAETPSLFTERRDPGTDFIAIPIVSSSNRKYIPIGYLPKNVVGGYALCLVPNATTYEFGVLTSIVHMVWIKALAGRLKSDFRYAPSFLYNTLVWPEPKEKQRKAIEATAQEILNQRNSEVNRNSSLAQLYDPLSMPDSLKKAHKDNDKAVLAAYGLKPSASEEEILAHLLKLYAEKIASQPSSDTTTQPAKEPKGTSKKRTKTRKEAKAKAQVDEKS